MSDKIESEVNIPQEVLERIDVLADKLGVATAGLWDVLVAQSRVEGYISFIWAGLSTLFVVVLAALAYKAWKYTIQEEEDAAPIAVLATLVTLIPLFATAHHLTNVVRYLVNPEWMALKLILSQFSGG